MSTKIARPLFVKSIMALGLAVALASASSVPAQEGPSAPGPLSAAQIHVLQKVLELFAGNTVGWHQELGDDFATDADILLRTGPIEGSTWRLAAARDPALVVFSVTLPTGTDESVVLATRAKGGSVQLDSLRASWEPQRPERRRSSTPEHEGIFPASAAMFGCSVLVLLGAWLVSKPNLRRQAGWSFGVWLGAFLGLLAFWGCHSQESESATAENGQTTVRDDRETSASTLVEWRRYLTGLSDTEPARGSQLPLIALWRAQEAWATWRREDGLAWLAKSGSYAKSPRGSLLSARFSLEQGEESLTAATYLKALEQWPQDELWLLEAIEYFRLSGFDERVEELEDRLVALGSRWREPYETLALSAAIADRPFEAAGLFRIGMELEPQVPGRIIRGLLSSYLLELTPTLRAAIDPGSTATPGCLGPASRPLVLPANAQAWLLGQALVVEVGETRLEVDGACEVVPAAAKRVTAGEWDHLERQRQLAGFRRFATRTGDPRFSHARALAALGASEEENWPLVEEVTASLGVDGQTQSDLETLRLRVKALRWLGQEKEASQLLLAGTEPALANRVRDPLGLFFLAEYLRGENQHDLVLRLIAAAQRRLPFLETDDLRTRITIEKRLLGQSLIEESEHFKIYFPSSSPPYIAQSIADYLEKELKRLARWIPLSQVAQIDVMLLGWDDFRVSYWGEGIAGLYDGRIRVPLAEFAEIEEPIARLLSHELTHALLDQATSGRAPRWFHEGLAQWVEPGRHDANPFRALQLDHRLLPFETLEDGFFSPASREIVSTAYLESLWAIAYLHERHGDRGLVSLSQAFRQGKSTRLALNAVTGQSPEAFSRQWVEWGLGEKAKLISTPGYGAR